MALDNYLQDGANERFEDQLQNLCEFETRNDTLRRRIETKLYQQMLIPDSRGDVLGLLENLDQVLGDLQGGLFAFSIERPGIPNDLNNDYENLASASVSSVDHLVLAAQAFFRNPHGVSDSIHKVIFFEKEADKISTTLKRAIFQSDLEIAQKIHLKYISRVLSNISIMSPTELKTLLTV